MKIKQFIYLFALLVVFAACSNDDDNTNPMMMDDDGVMMDPEPDFTGTFSQSDQMGRPAVNTVFVSSASKDSFNTSIPSEQQAAINRLRVSAIRVRQITKKNKVNDSLEPLYFP